MLESIGSGRVSGIHFEWYLKGNDGSIVARALRHRPRHGDSRWHLRNGSGHLDLARPLVVAKNIAGQCEKALVPGLLGGGANSRFRHQIPVATSEYDFAGRGS